METSAVDQVVSFYEALFDGLFTRPFRPGISDRFRLNAVSREVQISAEAASQALIRFFDNQQLSPEQVASVLIGFEAAGALLTLEDIRNPNASPESLTERLLAQVPCPDSVRVDGREAMYRAGLHSVVQVLMLVGPVMAEWQRLSFSTTFELPRRVANRLNQIGEQLGALATGGQSAADQRYELQYRDYLLQRFYRVEAGTVRMTTSLAVDLRELFVMPQVLVPPRDATNDSSGGAAAAPMDLQAARALFSRRGIADASSAPRGPKPVSALAQVKQYPRNVIVGMPGSGKSTFLEWLQLRLAAVEEEMVMSGKQAIPLLLRVRQLVPQNLPHGVALVEAALASRDQAALMPAGWIERQMAAGRVLFMLDGLDEVEPELRDTYVIQWLVDISRQYPNCRYLLSSRPVGYPPHCRAQLDLVECDLRDFDHTQVVEYTCHWCTAVRLARNEPEHEARQEGEREGQLIVTGFDNHPYIGDLARNPLMLSAICLVNYFEHGRLPEDRVVLYRLCVEGLLHHWDQRRGIHTQFSLEEKLRTCREVALAMQSDDRAEYEVEKVRRIFAAVLNDETRANQLLEHIRYRTGLLLERRAGVFAFAHLTFQEYLSALAIHQGNRLGIDAARLVSEHADGRWNEVIALYCGLSTAPAAREMIASLMCQPDSAVLGSVLVEAYLAAGPELAQDRALRKQVVERAAPLPELSGSALLDGFPPQEVAEVANAVIGAGHAEDSLCNAFRWLQGHPTYLDPGALARRLDSPSELNSMGLSELIFLLHAYAPTRTLLALPDHVYVTAGPRFGKDRRRYASQAEIALIGLSERLYPLERSSGRARTGARSRSTQDEVIRVLLRCLRIICAYPASQFEMLAKDAHGWIEWERLVITEKPLMPGDPQLREELVQEVGALAARFGNVRKQRGVKAPQPPGEREMDDGRRGRFQEALLIWARSLATQSTSRPTEPQSVRRAARARRTAP